MVVLAVTALLVVAVLVLAAMAWAVQVVLAAVVVTEVTVVTAAMQSQSVNLPLAAPAASAIPFLNPTAVMVPMEVMEVMVLAVPVPALVATAPRMPCRSPGSLA